MGLQTRQLAMAALGVQGDAPPNTIQPRLADGVHLRWAFARSRGFPRFGFHLFRREHRAGVPRWLSEHTGSLPAGPWSDRTLDTAAGRLSSDRPLLLTEEFPPSGSVEFDLRDRAYLRFALPSGAAARWMECRVGFRDHPAWPAKVCVDFEARSPGAGPNPRREVDPATGEAVVFDARHQNGTPRPNTHIQSINVGGSTHTGLSCEGSLEITLPAASSYVEATVSGTAGPVTVEAFNEDGSLAGRKTSADPKGPKNRGPELLRVDGSAITRAVVRDEKGKSLLHRFCCQPIPVTFIHLTAFAGRTPVAHAVVSGRPGQVKSAVLEFDGLDAVEASPGPAALLDVGVVALADDATVGWAPAPGFPAPMRLPLTHPDYPCTPGAAEHLEQARLLARQRVSYGDPAAYTSATARPSSGTVTTVSGSPIVTGSGTTWGPDLVGAALRVGDDQTAYLVLAVLAVDRLVLSRPYGGAGGAGRTYVMADDRFAQLHDELTHLVAGGASPPMAERIVPAPVTARGSISIAGASTLVTGVDTGWGPELVGLVLTVAGEATPYVVAEVQSATQLRLEHPYVGAGVTAAAYAIAARPHGAGPGREPDLPQHRPLDVVLLSTLHPAFAQMLGLYWVDRAAQPGAGYDYLLVGDYDGRGELDPAKLLTLIQQNGFDGVDAFIVYSRSARGAPALAPPADVRAYALPDTSAGGTAVGLRWDLGRTEEGVLVPGGAIMYHLWRAELGPTAPAQAPPPAQYALRSARAPLLFAAAPEQSGAAQRAPDWPPFPLHTIDGGTSDGWYSYRVSGIDVFGRHSAASAPAAWHQWSPAPEPRPWYYQDPPSDAVVHAFAVQVPDFVPPPPPSGVEGYALDPADPAVVRDAAYEAWWAALQAAPWYQALTAAQKRELIGLRVRWRWTAAQMRQAPDLREFRIYYQPGRLNALVGHAAAVLAAGTAESTVQTTISNDRPVDAYAGAWLRVGTDTFTIAGSEGGTPLRLRVRNLGVRSEVRPRPNAPCTVALPPFYAEGRVEVASGSPVVLGDGTAWTGELAGRLFQVVGDLATYVVASVDSPVRLTLRAPYAGPSAPAKSYGIRHPLVVDYSAAAVWDRRMYVVESADPAHVRMATEANGEPIWLYDVFLPRPDGSFRDGLPLAPSRGDPVAYAHVGVSAADDTPYAPDARTTGALSGRAGNEGRLAPPSTVFRVLRDPPPAPLTPPFPEVLHATRADALGRSRFTFRWLPDDAVRAHVFRALDEAVLGADWKQRPRPVLDPAGRAADRALFPTDARWTDAKCAAVAAELNGLDAAKTGGASLADARSIYRTLSHDAWRVLAGLPGNDAAFTQITVEPLDPSDPANADRRGEDDPDAYVPDAALRTYGDVLEGRTANRYFYRSAYVDGAGNRGAMGLASAPVELRDTLAPRAPVLTRAEGGAGAIMLRWVSNREPDLAEYHVHRGASEEACRDLRLMELVHTETVPDGEPAVRPLELSWSDAEVDVARPYWYRLTAIDYAGNASTPSAAVQARAFRLAPPGPVTWVSAGWNVERTAVHLKWEADETGLQFLVQRRASGSTRWVTVSPWLAEDTMTFDDATSTEPGDRYYRVRSRDRSGRVSTDFVPRLVQ